MSSGLDPHSASFITHHSSASTQAGVQGFHLHPKSRDLLFLPVLGGLCTSSPYLLENSKIIHNSSLTPTLTSQVRGKEDEVCSFTLDASRAEGCRIRLLHKELASMEDTKKRCLEKLPLCHSSVFKSHQLLSTG